MKKGPLFEKQVVAYLRRQLGDGAIERRVMGGRDDRGDVAGVYFRGRPMVLEVKNRRSMELSEWVDEAERERGNADAEYAVVVHKRRGKGEAAIGESYVTMTLETLAAMIAGGRDALGADE